MNEAGFLLDMQEAKIGADLIRYRDDLEDISDKSLEIGARHLRAAAYSAKVAAERLDSVRALRRSQAK